MHLCLFYQCEALVWGCAVCQGGSCSVLLCFLPAQSTGSRSLLSCGFPNSAPSHACPIACAANLTCTVLCLTFKSLMYGTQGPTHNGLPSTAHLVSLWEASLSCWQSDPWKQCFVLHSLEDGEDLLPANNEDRWSCVLGNGMEAMSLRDEQLWDHLGVPPGITNWRWTKFSVPVQELNPSMMQHLPDTGTSTRCPQRGAEGETKKLPKVFIQFINTWRELKGKDISRKIASPHQAVECHWKVLSDISRWLAPPALDWRKLSVHINITFILLSLLKSLWTLIFFFRHGELYYHFIWRK